MNIDKQIKKIIEEDSNFSGYHEGCDCGMCEEIRNNGVKTVNLLSEAKKK